MFTVRKPFKTVNRKFAAGDAIAAGDIHPQHPFGLDHLADAGFVETAAAPAPAPADETQETEA